MVGWVEGSRVGWVGVVGVLLFPCAPSEMCPQIASKACQL